ncbi:MAG: chemotaxis protein CheC [Dehalococcoidales bacterium]
MVVDSNLGMNLGDNKSLELMSKGINNAVVGLSQMSGQDIKVIKMTVRKVLVKDISDLFGGPEAVIIAVYLEITGNSNGHMVVVYEPSVAYELVDMLMGQPTGTTKELTDMESSALGEVGNVMGSFFLNYLADSTGKRFQPSPPAVMMDMAGAVLDSTLADILAYSDETYVMEAVFGTKDRQVAGTFLALPLPTLDKE